MSRQNGVFYRKSQRVGFVVKFLQETVKFRQFVVILRM